MTHVQPTSAMLACRKANRQVDRMSLFVQAIARSLPPLDQFVQRHAPDGRVGPVPLGLAVLIVLAALFSAVGLGAVGAIAVAMILGIYLLPLVVKTLISTIMPRELPSVEVVRVQGSLRARPETTGAVWDAYVLDHPSGVLAPLTAAVYQYAARVGHPLADERSSLRGTEYVNVGYLLTDHAATVLLPDRVLLDLRTADGRVVYRHAAYVGEPNDRTADPLVTDASPASVKGAMRYGAPTSPPRWQPTTSGRLLVQSMPTMLSAELRASFNRAVTLAGLVNGAPLAALILAAIAGREQFFVLIAAVCVIMFVGARLARRASDIWLAHTAPTIVRYVGTVYLRTYNNFGQRRERRTRYHVIQLDDSNEMSVTQDAFDRLAERRQLVSAEAAPWLWQARSGQGVTLEAFAAEGIQLIFEPSASLILEIRDADDALIYRDSAVSPNALGQSPA